MNTNMLTYIMTLPASAIPQKPIQALAEYYLILIVNWIALTLCNSILLCSFKTYLQYYCYIDMKTASCSLDSKYMWDFFF